MARRTTRRGHGRTEVAKLVGAAAIGLVTLCAIGGGIYLWITTPKPTLRDPVTMCPAADPTNIVVVVLDTSDGLPDASRDEVFTYLKDLVESSPTDAMLDVRSLDPAFRSGRPLLTLCNPGNGEGISEFRGNPELAKRKWREKFREPMLKALAGGLKQGPSAASPILQTLQGIAIERFTSAGVSEAHKELVVVSDMIEYGPNYSQYPPGDLNYRRFKTTPFYQKVRTNLHDAEITIFYIQRVTAKPLNAAQHIQFWLDWITDNNGQQKKAIRLQGAGKS